MILTSKNILKIILAEILNIFKASQTILIILPYYIIFSTIISILSVILFGSAEGFTLINKITQYFSTEFTYPQDDTDLILKTYAILTFLIYIFSHIYNRIIKTKKKETSLKTKIKIHSILLGCSYFLFCLIILPVKFQDDILNNFIVYTVLYILLLIMMTYYFFISKIITIVQYIILGKTPPGTIKPKKGK